MRYAGIINNDVVNGYDVCVSYWCQGCHFRCPGCHNPQTWDFNSGITSDDDDIITSVINAISNNGVRRNLSILGGEPLCDENIAFTQRLINEVVNVYPSIKIFLWTGYTIEDILTGDRQDFKPTLYLVDVLVDGQFELEHRDITLPFRGSENQRVIDVKSTLEGGDITLYEQ